MFQTLQGEGPFAGTPAVFVRLSGCNLLCPKCDTEYTSKRVLFTPAYLLSKIFEVYTLGTKLIVLTGGEPLRQGIGPFIRLATKHFKVQIETNGTYWQEGMQNWEVDSYGNLSFVCSPKTPKVNIDKDGIDLSWKYILKEGEVDPEDGLPLSSLDSGLRPYRPKNLNLYNIFVQPMDEGDTERNKLNTQAALDSCMKFGYRLSLQLHKQLNLP